LLIADRGNRPVLLVIVNGEGGVRPRFSRHYLSIGSGPRMAGPDGWPARTGMNGLRR
jgi:hypothetical protein